MKALRSRANLNFQLFSSVAFSIIFFKWAKLVVKAFHSLITLRNWTKNEQVIATRQENHIFCFLGRKMKKNPSAYFMF